MTFFSRIFRRTATSPGAASAQTSLPTADQRVAFLFKKRSFFEWVCRRPETKGEKLEKLGNAFFKAARARVIDTQNIGENGKIINNFEKTLLKVNDFECDTKFKPVKQKKQVTNRNADGDALSVKERRTVQTEFDKEKANLEKKTEKSNQGLKKAEAQYTAYETAKKDFLEALNKSMEQQEGLTTKQKPEIIDLIIKKFDKKADTAALPTDLTREPGFFGRSLEEKVNTASIKYEMLLDMVSLSALTTCNLELEGARGLDRNVEQIFEQLGGNLDGRKAKQIKHVIKTDLVQKINAKQPEELPEFDRTRPEIIQLINVQTQYQRKALRELERQFQAAQASVDVAKQNVEQATSNVEQHAQKVAAQQVEVDTIQTQATTLQRRIEHTTQRITKLDAQIHRLLSSEQTNPVEDAASSPEDSGRGSPTAEEQQRDAQNLEQPEELEGVSLLQAQRTKLIKNLNALQDQSPDISQKLRAVNVAQKDLIQEQNRLQQELHEAIILTTKHNAIQKNISDELKTAETALEQAEAEVSESLESELITARQNLRQEAAYFKAQKSASRVVNEEESTAAAVVQ